MLGELYVLWIQLYGTRECRFTIYALSMVLTFRSSLTNSRLDIVDPEIRICFSRQVSHFGTYVQASRRIKALVSFLVGACGFDERDDIELKDTSINKEPDPAFLVILHCLGS